MAKTKITFLKVELLLFAGLFISLISSAQQTDFTSDVYSGDLHRADSIANIYKGEDLYNLPLLVYKLTNTLESDVEKFRSIYTWVCSNIENEFWYYQKNKKKRKRYRNDSLALEEWNSYLLPLVFKKLREEKATLCSGYAYLVKEMAGFADIECEIIDGYGRNKKNYVTIIIGNE